MDYFARNKGAAAPAPEKPTPPPVAAVAVDPDRAHRLLDEEFHDTHDEGLQTMLGAWWLDRDEANKLVGNILSLGRRVGRRLLRKTLQDGDTVREAIAQIRAMIETVMEEEPSRRKARLEWRLLRAQEEEREDRVAELKAELAELERRHGRVETPAGNG